MIVAAVVMVGAAVLLFVLMLALCRAAGVADRAVVEARDRPRALRWDELTPAEQRQATTATNVVYARFGPTSSTGVPKVMWGPAWPVCVVCGQATPGTVQLADRGRFVWVHRWPCAERLR